MKRQKVPRGTPALKEHSLAFQAGWPREGTQASKLADALVWNLITAQLCLREVASLQVACSGFEGRVRFLVSYWLQTLPPGQLRHVRLLAKEANEIMKLNEINELNNDIK